MTRELFVKDFAGQRAVVTGASSGIGRATALRLARRGAHTAMLARSVEALLAQVSELTAVGCVAVAQGCDVAEPDSVEVAIDSVTRQFGGIDILLNIAGISSGRALVGDDDPRAWISTIQTNLIGPYLCAHYALPYLRQSPHGRILNIGSGMRGAFRRGGSAYDCSKAALWKLTQVLALERRSSIPF